ncbi:MAG: hypothetical protein GX306_00215 [Clostridiales bacterium]|jgi:hypothetical protein|nr:hypothetical protein [Clostridiales bacterium]
MKKISILLIVLMLLMTGCGGKEETPEDTGNADGTNKNATVNEETSSDQQDKSEESQVAGFEFEYNGVTIPLNVDVAPILEELGESMDYFEAPSCAFQGLDKIYYYSGFELSTYPLDKKDFISSINLLDDTVTTKEGIYLGATLDDVISTYGEEYSEENGFYTYTLGETQLTFVVENDVVTAITYLALVEGLEG